VSKVFEIDTAATLQRQRSKRPGPKIEVFVSKTYRRVKAPAPQPPITRAADPTPPVDKYTALDELPAKVNEVLLQDLWAEFKSRKTDRAKLSNGYHQLLYEQVGSKILSGHYARIEAVSDELKEIYDKIRYVERYGELPEPPKESQEETDIYKLKEEKRSLVNRRCKVAAKLKNTTKYPSGSSKRQELQAYLDRMNIEYEQVQDKIMSIKYE